jgi:peptidoglycan/LPS O-acetylase OafA/YrhL
VKPRIPGWMFPVTLFLLIVWGAHVERAEAAWFLTLVLGLVLPFHKPFRTSLYTRVCHHVAKYSYGIYLVHPFALVVGVYLLRGHVGVAVQLAVAMVVLVVVSLIAYHGLEKPMIGYGARLAARVEVRRLGRRPGARALAQVLPEWAEGLRG